MIYGKLLSDVCDWNTFHRGYIIFCKCLVHEDEIAHGCPKCPDELTDSEENYESIEVHTADAVNAGNVVNDLKGYPEECLFGNKAPEGAPLKRGIEAQNKII